jgi:hypothetical protein
VAAPAERACSASPSSRKAVVLLHMEATKELYQSDRWKVAFTTSTRPTELPKQRITERKSTPISAKARKWIALLNTPMPRKEFQLLTNIRRR